MKYYYSFAFIFLNFIALTYADYQTFDLGFKQGYKSVGGTHALVPITPIKPITPIASSDYLEGFKLGVLAADSKNQESTRTVTAALLNGLEIELQAHKDKRERERMARKEFNQQWDMKTVLAAQISAKLMVYPKLKNYIQVNAPRSLQHSLKYMDDFFATTLADLNALDSYISTMIELDGEKFKK